VFGQHLTVSRGLTGRRLACCITCVAAKERTANVTTTVLRSDHSTVVNVMRKYTKPAAKEVNSGTVLKVLL
jgi:hypothetical protein